MSFHGILYEAPNHLTEAAQPDQPAFFADLNLDQVIESITAGRPEYDLTPFFFDPLPDVQTIGYRHEILRDLDNGEITGCINAFAEKMRSMREQLSQGAKLHYKSQQESWFLDAVESYIDAVTGFARDLALVIPKSRGLLGFRACLTDYASGAAFVALAAETRRLKLQLARITYCLNIRSDRIEVGKYAGQADYSADVVATFEKFNSGAVKDYRVDYSSAADMNHIEAGVLDLVARLHPEIFADLHNYYAANRGYLDRTVAAFDREVQFYLAYREFTARLERAGLTFCYPLVSDRSKEIVARDAFDLALADKLMSTRSPVVTNDFHLTEPERILVVSGPNQGGKTTLARTFGQMHYLASIGLPVPGSHAQLHLFDAMFTHFEREESSQDLNGKLQDDLLRIHEILQRATPRSVLILNEIFTSTTLEDAIFLGTRVMERIVELDALCICVTFIDELASASETTVSMVSTVVPDDPSVRTFKVERRPADGLSYAISIAEKYGLTYEALRKRIAQ